jgi:protein-tyrosine-phosphatase
MIVNCFICKSKSEVSVIDKFKLSYSVLNRQQFYDELANRYDTICTMNDNDHIYQFSIDDKFTSNVIDWLMSLQIMSQVARELE